MGRLGSALAKALSDTAAGHPHEETDAPAPVPYRTNVGAVARFGRKTTPHVPGLPVEPSAQRTPGLTQAQASDPWVLWFTTQDDALAGALEDWVSICQGPNPPVVVVHSSGIQAASALSRLGRPCVSLHPMRAFGRADTTPWVTGADEPPRTDSDHPFRGLFMSMEGDETALPWGNLIGAVLQADVRHVCLEEKKRLHLAATITSNFIVALQGMANDIMSKSQWLPHEVYRVTKPLITSALENLSKQRPHEAITGPAARGDLETLESHRQLLGEFPDYLSAYDRVTNGLLEHLARHRLDGAAQALSNQDPRLRRLIAYVGPCTLSPPQDGALFLSLLRAIVFQQLSGRAASTIHQRVLDLCYPDLPSPEALLDTPEAVLREAGLSLAKTKALHDLARAMTDGRIPPEDELNALEDEQVIKCLTQIRGVGPWTAQMHLMFTMGRLDVWPVADLGVQKGMALLHQREDLPTPAEMEALGAPWKPYRSIAAWYLWRLVDISGDPNQRYQQAIWG